MGTYHDMYDKYRNSVEKDSINDDIVFEMELVKQVEVNIDYILMLVEKYHKKNCDDKEVLVEIDKAIGSSSELRSKKELIKQFIESINVNSNVTIFGIPSFIKTLSLTESKSLILYFSISTLLLQA